MAVHREIDPESELTLAAVADTDIAIIGAAVRVPGASTIDRFWRNLCDGVESITRFARSELEPSLAVPRELHDHPDFVPAAGILGDIDQFDCEFFAIPHAEAQLSDPQHRVFLECAWSALEDAGYDPESYPGQIALYAGAAQSEHLFALLGNLRREPAALYQAMAGASPEGLVTKTSYRLHLRGESIAVNTACSTGLVAVHMAAHSLLVGQSDIALAGAVRIAAPERTGYLFQEGMIFSPDGHCRPFDHRARGTVASNGAGVVVLKPLASALRDGDHVYAVIKGSAINNDGRRKVGYTAPSVEGQRDVITQALANGGVDPDTIGYVEAHGTGTPLGDPIEIAALSRAFREGTQRRQYCALGSVKSNLGHLDTAAGVVGLIKAALALDREAIPPSLHFERPNDQLALDGSPFFVADRHRPWPRGAAPRRAAVSSFGIGGTNAHAVLEEAPRVPGEPSPRPLELIALSARSAAELEQVAAELADAATARPELVLADLAFTRNCGRRMFAHRRAIVADTPAALAAALRGGGRATEIAAGAQRVAWLVPGNGAAYPGMGRGLYAAEVVFRRALDRASAIIEPELGVSLAALIAAGSPAVMSPELASPALFAVQTALAALWRSWGIAPEAALGHSFGEYCAAHLAGVFSLEDGMQIARLRGRLIAAMPPGAMLAVALPADEAARRGGPAIELAADNGAGRAVVSGPVDAIDALRAALAADGIAATPLAVDRAFHTAAVEPAAAALAEHMARLELAPPRSPYVSSLTGAWIRAEEATSPAYWARQMREPVRFTGGVAALRDAGATVLLELGPDQALSQLCRAELGPAAAIRVVAGAPRRGDRAAAADCRAALTALGELFSAGLAVDWAGFYTEQARRRISLPAYPFARAQISRVAAPPVEVVERAPPPARGDAEEIVAGVWRAALGVAEIGRDDDFLAIGGNSLVAVQILTRLREAFPGVDIPLEDLFEASTVRKLGAQIDARRGGATVGAPTIDSATPSALLRAPPEVGLAIASAPAAGARPLSAVEQRVFAIEQAEPRTPALLMPIAVAFDGVVDERALEDGLHDLVARHPGLRSAYRLDRGGRPIAEPAAAPFTVERADLEPLAPAERARALEELTAREAARSFDIARGPLVRALWVRLGPAAHQLFLTVHHLVCDTASLELLCRDLAALYAARAQGRTAALPAPPIEYGDFAAWQARALDGELAAQRAYWRRQLEPMPPRLPFPAEHRAAGAPQFVSAAQPIAISARTTEALRGFCRSRATTPYVAVLAAYAALLGGTADRERVLIGTPFGNRSRRELASIAGYVAHSIGLAIALDGDPTFDELVARAHRTVLDGQRNSDVPFEALAPRQLGRLFDATFVLHGRLETTLEVPGAVTLRLLRPEAATQFGATLAELALILWEKGDALTGALRYNPRRFDAGAAAGYVDGLVALLEAAIARPAERVRSLVRPRPRAPARSTVAAPPAARPLELSLFYFASDEESLAGNKYRLLLDGAAAADRLGFRAIWTPERHFHSFGGTYPNPSVVGAAIAARTERIAIRAGSVVLPLHDPIRVAEEWSVVDNISDGRVGLSFASGWHAQDFILAPDEYGDRRQLMVDRIDTVRRLWRGEPHRGRDGTGAEIEVRIRPRPVQPELPFWVTSGGNRATFELAGELGGNLLTNLMGQRVDDLAEKIAAYRAARRRADGSAGHVTLMLHAFVGDDTARVRRTVRAPLRAYLRRSIDLLGGFVASLGLSVRPEQLTPSDLDALLDHGLDRYLDEAGLFGTPDDCLPLVRRVQALGVDEIACLIDFGVDPDEVLASLPALAEVGALANRQAAPAAPAPAPELPLSFVQERLWFLDQLEPGLAAYNNPVALRIRGELAAGALAASLDDVIQRHEILRTGFVRGDAGPVQQILDRAEVALERIDLAHVDDRDAELARRLTARAAEPFDLSRAPLVRAALYRLGPDDHVLLVVMHHIVSDGWSSGVLLRELALLYAAHAGGRPAPLPPLPIQYADFARWQRAQADSTEQLAFWRDQLAGVPALALPTDRPRPPRQTFRGALELVELPRALVDGLEALGKRERATPFMVLLAAFDVLLHRYSGQTDFAVGTPTANRTRPEHEALVGCFVNTLALRAELAGDPTFVELLGRIRRRTLAAYAHQDAPFERLLSELRIDRDLSRSPLFQVMLVLHNTPVPKVNLGALTLTGMPVDNGTAALDLMLELTPSAGGLAGWIKYNSDLFDGASIARFAQQLRHLAAAIVADPDARISALPLVSGYDVRVLAAGGERARAPRLFLDCFADAVERWPDRPAVIAPDGRLDYSALAARANQLAHRLRRRGAGPETVVGIHAERSTAFVAGVLGILEAGAAYLPLDPSHPPDRIAKLLADSGASIVVGPRDLDELAGEPTTRPAVQVRPESLAYVIYTSGSTGQPKGVAVEHRQLAGYLAAIAERAGLAEGRGYAHVSSFAADLGHTMLFPALAAGGTLHVLGDGDVFDPQAIAAAFAAHRIDYLKATPSHIAALASCDALPAERLILGGERLRWDVVDELAARRPGCEVINHYGPTETTVGVLTYAAAGRAAGATVPIGRPLAGVRAYLLDHRMNPVPIGVPGELYIGGDTVARGYLGRPGATAERFVPDPFGAGARLYRTGDRARWLAGGDVEFLGRLDEQVKIRGHRIEPAEIEAALRAQPNVRDAVVVARADERGEPRLIAYVAGGELAPHALRAGLQAILPRPMLPSAIVVLPALPLAPTGKLDRRALPAPPAADASDAVAPDGIVEETLVRLWAELLRVERVGATDDFFDLGGHSLLATQLCHRVREALGVELAVRALFEAPTPRELARRVAAQRAPISRDTGPIPRLTAAQKRGGVPLSHGQARIWFLQQLEPESPVYTVPMALRLTGPLDFAALGAALTEIVRRHEALRTVFGAARGEPLQIVADPVEIPVERADVSALPPDERAAAADRILRRAAARPFDLTCAPLLRALVVRTAADEHVLLLTVHHIAFDGWSTGVLFRELTALYAGEAAALPELPLGYADYAQWQRAWIERDVAAPQLAYWRRQLAGLPPQLSLPTDRPRPAVQSHRGHSIDIALSPELSRAVRELARREGATPHMVLFAAFEVLLARMSGQRDFAVGSPVANRTRPDVEELVGFFLNTLVMRADLSGAPAVRELLRRVKETALDAYAHQDLPFEQLVEQLGIERSLSRTPLFQVMFILQNAPLARRAPSGLVFAPVPVDSGAAELDLMVIVEDAPDAFVGHWGYCTDLFDADTIRRMAAHFAALLEQFAADPGAPIDRLVLCDPAERAALLAGARATAAAIPAASLIERIAETCARRGDACAIECAGQSLTYAALAARVGALSAALRVRGVGPEVRVAICVERSPELVVALLAVLHAGGAYVPLDPELPPARLARVIADSGAAVIVTQPELASALPSGAALQWVDAAPVADTPPPRPRSPEQLAYVMYTSGSTGAPKGVAIPHRALDNFAAAIERLFPLAETDAVVAVTTVAFDIAALEIFAPLVAGATLVVAPRDTARDGDALAALVERARPSLMQATPATWRMLVDAGWRGDPQLRILCGGEALPAPLAAALLDRGAALWNLYGPTETTIWSAARRVGRDESPPRIGGALANTQLHVLDEHGELLPAGIPGELYIGGAGVARGYLGRPELTAERFVPDPFSDAPGARMYRTGDLVRRRPDQTLEFLGRADRQIKVRGHRIELGEIEAALRAHPGVADAAVVGAADAAGQPRIIGYVAPSVETEDMSGLGAEWIRRWQITSDEVVRAAAAPAAPRENFAGWISSYTGAPIAEPEMREWVEHNVARILQHRPRTVLDVGCGPGLLLFAIAPHCERYVGIDHAPSALDYVRPRLADLPHVELAERTAHQLDDFAPASFDAVVFSSVVQYFPSAEYLLHVLALAVRATAPGGTVYIGDVRSLAHLEALHASIEQARAGAATAEQLRERVRRAVEREEELVLDPAFFAALAARLPAIERVRVELKGGRAHNELTRYRYDVTLHVGDPARPAPAPVELDPIEWRGLDLARLGELLGRSDALAVAGIPNARLPELRDDGGDEGIEPDALRELARAHAFDVELTWSRTLGELDAAFIRPGARTPPRAAEPGRPHSNRPLASAACRELPAQLRPFLGERLPDYMIPSALVAVPALPRLPNGKLDARALPPPEARAELDAGYVAPRTPAEARLAEIFAEVLGVARAGVHDDFFALGGHSLLATQVVSRIRASFAADLPLRALFVSPTIAALAASLGEAAEPDDAPPLIAIERAGDLELSFAQQRMWLLHAIAPESPVFHICGALRITGELDHAALAHALDALVQRHEALRTRFVSIGGTARQQIAPPAPILLEVVDAAAEHEIAEIAERAARTPFRLDEAPLFRTVLVRLSPSDHVLIVALHHIISDGWSLGVVIRELGELYAGRALPALEIQYADYAAWQRRWLAGARRDRELAHWRARLADLEPLDLPGDRPRPAQRTWVGGKVPVALDRAVTDRLDELARASGATLFMALAAAFQVWLGRLSGASRFGVGTPIANRTRREIEGVVGCFINTLVLRADLSGAPSFRDVLERVRADALDAYAHQQVPFEEVVEATAQPRDPSRHALFDVMLVLQNAPAAPLALPGLTLELAGIETGAAWFDLTLSLRPGAAGLSGVLEYSADLFDRATAERMAADFAALVAGVVANPSAVLGAPAPHLPAWNDTAAAYPRDRCIHELFAEQVAAAPDAIAIESAEETLTYRELDERACRLANHLAASGIGIESRVALCLPRSPDLIVAMLAVLKTGGAYVPLDPSYPPARLALMTRDAGAQLVITRRVLDAIGPDLGQYAATAPRVRVDPQNLAYVMYTSGSTGQPRAAAIPHRGVVRLATDPRDPALGRDRAILQLAPISFDVSTYEIWGALLRGARLVIFPAEIPTAAALSAILARSRVTTLLLTASLFHVLCDEDPALFRPLRHLLVGGEPLSPRHVARARSVLPDTAIINSYGPCECTTVATSHVVDQSGDRAIPIGRPVSNAAVYVLDARLEPVAIGVTGELFIAGDGLARGYLGRPELTAERFVPDPFGAVPGGRMYRTGDLVRRRRDGNLEFVGRRDHQVKVRGHRVELGEIEAALGEHPAVDACAVALRGERHLVGYVVSSEPDGALRDHLAQRLPDYMIPGAWVRLAALPLSPNGKLDRGALPAPAADADADRAPPRDPLEAQLLALWSGVLDAHDLGIRDDFFARGGNSLLAVRLVARLHAATGIALPLRDFFAAPTVEALAARLRADRPAPDTGVLVPLRTAAQSGVPLFCVHALGGTVGCYAELARALALPVYAIQAQGLDGAPLLETIPALARCYIDAIRGAQPRGPYRLAGWSLGGAIAYEIACQLAAAGEPIELLALIDSHAPPLPLSLDDDAARIAALRRELANSGIDPADLERHYQIALRNGRALTAYTPERYGGTLQLFRARDRARRLDPDLGWTSLAARVIAIDVPGDHDTMLRGDGAAALARHLETLAAR